MKNKLDDTFLKKLAQSYAETEGQKLQEELKSAPLYSTPRMDSRIRQRIKAEQGRSFSRRFGVLAAACLACLACLVAGLALPSLLRSGITDPPPGLSSPGDTTGDLTLMPLSFTLPDNLTNAGSSTDQGQSIYYLRDVHQDDVVLVMEKSGQQPAADGLTPVKINGQQAYAKATGDYSYLTFSRDGILYTMTCRHDVNTLISLGEKIL
jgi:hypothetical protein